MNKIEFLSASLPYGLLIYDGYSYMQLYTVDVSNKYLFIKEGGGGYSRTFNESKPVIRHFDSLTQECVQADYNDGKPFIPIVELAKMAFPMWKWAMVDGKCVDESEEFYWDVDSFYCIDRSESNYLNIDHQLQLFQQLLKWHFWPNKPESEEVVYVTNEFNPYC